MIVLPTAELVRSDSPGRAVLADKLVKIVEDYFTALRDVHRLGAGTPERSYYTALAALLNAIGADLTQLAQNRGSVRGKSRP